MDHVYRLIISHHEHLANWLREGNLDSLGAFLEAHDPAFSLVTTDGEIVKLSALSSGLDRAGGSRPGLKIIISGMTHLVPGVCRFLEQHEVDGDIVDLRVVTAVLRDGRMLGVQETDRPVAHK